LVPFIGSSITGNYYVLPGLQLATALTTRAGATGELTVGPVKLPINITPAAIGIAVSTAVANTRFRIVLYDSTASGWPSTQIWQSHDFSGSTPTGLRSTTGSMPTLTGGIVYWVGIHHSGNCTLRAIPLGSAFAIGGILTAGASTTFGTVVRRTGLTYDSGSPTGWGSFTGGQIVAGISPYAVLALI
jgi:hypothetical protein